jgi:hypothetical protein
VSLSASDSFKAVAGTNRVSGFGAGATLTGIWEGLFADIAFSQQKLDGQRVFATAGTVYELGIPLEITLRPIDVGGGWRFLAGRISPYVGAGVTFVSYKETADFAQTGDDVSERQAGLLILGGLDVALIRWLYAGAEVRYRGVNGILGTGGVSGVYNEDSLGGVAVAVRMSVGR